MMNFMVLLLLLFAFERTKDRDNPRYPKISQAGDYKHVSFSTPVRTMISFDYLQTNIKTESTAAGWKSLKWNAGMVILCQASVVA